MKSVFQIILSVKDYTGGYTVCNDYVLALCSTEDIANKQKIFFENGFKELVISYEKNQSDMYELRKEASENGEPQRIIDWSVEFKEKTIQVNKVLEEDTKKYLPNAKSAFYAIVDSEEFSTQLSIKEMNVIS